MAKPIELIGESMEWDILFPEVPRIEYFNSGIYEVLNVPRRQNSTIPDCACGNQTIDNGKGSPSGCQHAIQMSPLKRHPGIDGKHPRPEASFEIQEPILQAATLAASPESFDALSELPKAQRAQE